MSSKPSVEDTASSDSNAADESDRGERVSFSFVENVGDDDSFSPQIVQEAAEGEGFSLELQGESSVARRENGYRALHSISEADDPLMDNSSQQSASLSITEQPSTTSFASSSPFTINHTVRSPRQRPPSTSQDDNVSENKSKSESSSIASLARIHRPLRHAATVLTDFIPLVGTTSALHHHHQRYRRTASQESSHHSIQSRRYLDTSNTHELDHYPLHHACVLSASHIGASTKQLDATLVGEKNTNNTYLGWIQALVEEDPSRLYQRLPACGSTPLHLAIRFGAVQWQHKIQDYPGSITNLSVIEYLIGADIDYQRRLAVETRNQKERESGSVSKTGQHAPISLTVLIHKSAMYQKDNMGDLPLHVAAHDGYEGAALALLRVDKDAHFDTILQGDDAGNLPLHLAVERDDLSMVSLLLAADKKRAETKSEFRRLSIRTVLTSISTQRKSSSNRQKQEFQMQTLFQTNTMGDTCLHLALESPHQITLWNLLLEFDTKKETLHISNAEGITPFQFFADQPHLFQNDPSFIDLHLADAILDHLLAGRRLEPWDAHLRRSVSKSAEMQSKTNWKAAGRLSVAIFCADFFANIISVILLLLITQNVIEHPLEKLDLPGMDSILFVLGAYFGVREFVQLLLSKALYWNNIWNYAGIVRAVMMFTVALILEGAFLDLSNAAHLKFGRRILLTLAVTIFLGVLSFLRLTYISFALFVGGTSKVVVKLVPFAVTAFLAMALFAYGYWVGGFVSTETNANLSYTGWLLQTFVMALGDPIGLVTMEDAYIDKVWWTILYALLIQILLLNVLIAVITSAWEEIRLNQKVVFWGYRLEFAAGILPIEYFIRKVLKDTCLLRSFTRAANFFDSLDKVDVFDRVNWEAYPYSKVLDDPSLYWNTQEWRKILSSETDKALRSYHSYPGHAEFDPEKLRSFQADHKFARSFSERIHARIRLVGFLILYTLAFIFGFATFGFTWPRRIRTLFCAPSATRINDGENKESAAIKTVQLDPFASPGDANLSKNENEKALERKVDTLAENVAALQKTVEHLAMLLQSGQQIK